jgi:NADH dehydrogenase FAD-containing subunit
VDACLRSTSHADVLAAGGDASEACSSNVGASLAVNLRAILAGIQPKPWILKVKSLKLMSCGDQSAIAMWGNTCAQGRWLGWLKDWLERRSIRSLIQPQPGQRL